MRRSTTGVRAHQPELTTLYRLVQQHVSSFIVHTEASTGSELPRFVKDEFDAFLERGIAKGIGVGAGGGASGTP